LYTIQRQSQVAEDVFIKMERHYPGLRRFRGDFITMTNHQRPIRSVIDLIQSLKAQGFSLFILSNIGQETFVKLCTHYPLLNEYFEGAFTARSENKYVHKPHPEFYESFKEFVAERGHGDKQILFVDDLKKNVAAAAQCSIAGVHFTSPKQLIRTFKKLNILK
jgi:FMN phosphatase YigB (HAD superfamily)